MHASQRQQQPKHSPENRQQGTLHKELSDDLLSCGSKREAHSHFLASANPARQHQVRNIRAGENQNESHRALQHQQCRPNVLHAHRFQRHQDSAEPLAAGPLAGDARHCLAHLGSRLGKGCVRPQPTEDTKIGIGSVQPCIVERHHDVYWEQLIERSGQHADDGVILSVEGHALPANSWISLVLPLPVAVTHDRQSAARRFFFGQKCSSNHGNNSEEISEIGGHSQSGDLFRRAVPCYRAGAVLEEKHILERVDPLFPPVEVVLPAWPNAA